MLIETRGLTKTYIHRKSFAGSPHVMVAVDNVTLQIEERSVLALVGASGSGKSTLVKCLLGLEKPTSGSALYRDSDISRLSRAQAIRFRQRVQLVFQDVSGAINPRFTAAAAVSEPLRVAGIGTPAWRKMQAMHWLNEVRLLPQMADRPALEFSGGERQRLAIARALIVSPELVVFDEAFSALDAPVQGHLIDLIGQLRREYNFTCLFVSHDLSFLARICQTAVVMYKGQIVERASMDSLLSAPRHPYSQALVQAIPRFPGDA
jgi:peptide/nickel transport system ATP-binding protein